jgi:hypothetical protein
MIASKNKKCRQLDGHTESIVTNPKEGDFWQACSVKALLRLS